MKRFYSRLGILNRELTPSNKESLSFLRQFLPKSRYLTIVLPYYDYLRGQCFIDDLRDNFGEDFPIFFGMGELLYLLYDDFLMQIKQGANNDKICKYLMDSYNKYFKPPKRTKTVMKPITKNFIQFETIEEEIQSDNDEKKAYLTVKLKESEVLRGEVLLFDLSPKMGNLEISVEQMITIIYLDFIERVKSEGNSMDVQKSLVAKLKRF